MKTPSLQRAGKKTPTQQGEPVMDSFQGSSQGYNTFDMSTVEPTTQRFGDAVPSFFFEGVPGDRIIHRSTDDIKANSLVAPLMSEVYGYEDVFTVPISSLYPYNWQKMITNPTKGDDLPDDALPNFDILNYISRLCFATDAPNFGSADNTLYTSNGNMAIPPSTFSKGFTLSSTSSAAISAQLRLCQFLRAMSLLSSDSLLYRTGYGLDYIYTVSESDDSVPYVEGLPVGEKYNLQTLIGFFYTRLLEVISELQKNTSYVMKFYLPSALDDSKFSLSTIVGSYTVYEVSLSNLSVVRDWLNRTINEGGFFTFSAVEEVTGTLFPTVVDPLGGYLVSPTSLSNHLSPLIAKFGEAITHFNSDRAIHPQYYKYNPSRLLAYQQTIASYYSNAVVDYIYTAQLYMQNLQSSFMNPVSGTTGTVYQDIIFPTFSYNGVRTMYDLLTDGFLNYMFVQPSNYYFRLSAVYANLFSFGNSLRNADFFTSSRPHVLAVGDISISVSNEKVSAIDSIQSIVKARYLHVVNRVSSELHSYLDNIFGISPLNDMPEPHFCSRQRLSVARSFNTDLGNELGTQNTNIVGSGTTPSVDIFLDETCIVLGIRTFGVKGSYRRGINPHLLNNDRFTMYNPLLQALGDQAISSALYVGDPSIGDEQFGFTERYGEYKMPVSFATGGAQHNLPGWFFFYDSMNPNSYTARTLSDGVHIKPSLIRHYPIEFDGFYKTISSIDPSVYYHFIIHNFCSLTAQRKMSYNSGLLWLN